MNNYSPELNEFLNLLDKKSRMLAMLAPSFIIDFNYPQIISSLKKLGFSYVLEVARGAQETNRQLKDLLQKYPNRRFITSPCPTTVRLIKSKYPHLLDNLAKIDSPMSATAKLASVKYPGYRPVFIGPCIAKKLESKEDWPELKILVLTYKELKEAFKIRNVAEAEKEELVFFDEAGKSTRMYPVSGGLAHSAGLNDILTDEEYDVISGRELVEKTLGEFPQSKLRLLDILYCDGGCISGPGIVSGLDINQKRQKVISYWAKGIA